MTDETEPPRRRPTRVVLVGLGAIGAALADECVRRSDFEVLAAVDPLKEGTKVGPVDVQSTFAVPPARLGDVAFVTTRSSLQAAAGELEAAMKRGFDVVTTCEELAFPWASQPVLAKHLDRVAKARGVRLLGCGVNPGFVMDALPVMVSGTCMDVRSIRVSRAVDLARRRPQLAKKMGTGLDEGTWRSRARKGDLGHRGLVESAHLCAMGVGWPVESVAFDRRPVLRAGTVTGVQEVVDLRASEGRSIQLELRFEVGTKGIDEVHIDGRPPLRLTFDGGVQGDEATIARLINCARFVQSLPPGLRLPIEVPPWGRPAAGNWSKGVARRS
jgi:hypothetical protein